MARGVSKAKKFHISRTRKLPHDNDFFLLVTTRVRIFCQKPENESAENGEGMFRPRRYNGTVIIPVISFCLSVFLVETLSAQVVNPADKQTPPEQTSTSQQGTEVPIHTWSLPPIEVYGKAPLKEEDRIGVYAQPRWTAQRRFGETRIYVVPKGMVEFEYWLVPERSRDGSAEIASQYEMEFGLPGRFQLDLYAVTHQAGNKGALKMDEQKVELRWALADWNKIWGNPTIYLEWKGIHSAPDHMEAKLLLGGEISSGWHWGSNFIFEHEMGGFQENSNEWTTGLSYTVRDTKVSVGMESQLALVNAKNSLGIRGALAKQFLLGPSVQFRPVPQMHVDVAPLLGATHSAPRSKLFVIVGWEF